MKNIQVVAVQEPSINPIAMTQVASQITQHPMSSVDDFMYRLEAAHAKPSKKFVQAVQQMGHESVTRHGVYTVLVMGASRRFLAQIRTHHVGIDFTSGSMQYQNLTDKVKFVVPYEIYQKADEMGDPELINAYLNMCQQTADNYKVLTTALDLDKDTAGYVAAQASRNVLLITANVEAWRNLIYARSCNRNTAETQYTTMLIWKALLQTKYGDAMFGTAGPGCTQCSGCTEGRMSCGEPWVMGCKDTLQFVEEFIDERWPLLKKY